MIKSNKQIAQMALARLSVTAANGKEPDDAGKLAWIALKAGAAALKAKGYDAKPQMDGVGKESGYIRVHGKDTFVDLPLKVNKAKKYGIS